MCMEPYRVPALQVSDLTVFHDHGTDHCLKVAIALALPIKTPCFGSLNCSARVRDPYLDNRGINLMS